MKSLLKLLREGETVTLGLLLAALVLGTFLPVLHNDFINYDDPSYVYANPHVRAGLTGDSVHWAFTTLERGFWHPLTWLSIMVDWELYGPDAGGHHLTSLLLHTANTLLLFLVFRRMTGAPWRSFVVAALFALHPLHVESVAWAAERKDVLSTFFFMLTLLAYAEYVEAKAENRKQKAEIVEHGGRFQLSAFCFLLSAWYGLALALFTLGLMSKSMVMTLPAVLLLLDYWPLGRFNNKDQKSKLKILIEKLPFLAVSLLFGLVTVVAQRQSGALKTTTHFPVPARLANAILSYWEYLWQTIWPARLAVFYSYPKAFSLSGVAAVALLGVAALMLAFLAARKRPYLAFGSLWYLVTLLPVIGIIQVGSQSHADRYTYVPLIGVFVLLAWGASDLVRNRPARPAILTIAAALVLLPCLLLTHRQIGYWRDSETLYRHALAVTENNELAQNNLGTTLKRPGQEDEAIRHFQEAVRLAPDYALAYGNLGAALFSRGRLDESILASREAVRLKPDFAGAHRNLGAALGAKGHVDEAIFHLEQTVKLDPGDAQGHYNLGFAFLTKGRFDDAIAQFQETLRLKPDFTEAQRALQAALAAKEGKSPQRGH